ncbi:PTS transporter subunit EIIC [Xylocopilactobacillus apicola]|uniref:PTS sugar transporter subunit IIC n=1 Tax=Xylocopilactobacillus apicola TaxID=2932184 RepID=A0AAU9D5I4_9LACO|nr:PTS transporter subunit EIIC [Xylocopilactobacillus apicola]BDR57731.1 PTS sugar transporter subunit IIC [Xylocopilactobacillus apicola]
MKEKLQNAMQTFARSIIQPVMFMAVTGIIIALAAIFKLEAMPKFVQDVGNLFFTVLSSGIIGQLSVIFCVGISAAIAKKHKTDAAILGISVYLIFLYTNNFWLNFTHRLAKAGSQGLFGTGQSMVLGIQVTDMGVFLGIILGCLVGYFINRWGGVKFHKYFASYEGTKFVFLLLIFTTIILAILVTYIWPPINALVSSTVKLMGTSGAVGLFAYGFLNRMLLPIGMHHLLWMPLYYSPLGGTAMIAGKSYSGALNIFLAEVGNISKVHSMDWSIGFLVNFGYIFLPIGIALAFIKTAKPENKAKVKGLVIPAVMTAMLAGITEPIEFMFLFISPILWLAHGIIYGLGLVIPHIFGLKIMVGNVIETIMYCIAIPMRLGHQWLIIPIGILMVVIEYFAFKFLILKFNIPTVGREEELVGDEALKTTGSEVISTNDTNAQMSDLIKGLGGASNIQNLENCYSRLRIDVRDISKIDLNLIKQFPSSGVINKKNNIQIVIGPGVESTRDELDSYIAGLGTKDY